MARVSKKDTERFDKTSSDLGNTLVVLRGQLHELETEIRADASGSKEFEDQLDLLRREKEFLTKRHSANEVWAAEFDAAIGPFERKYGTLTGDIKGLYENAKVQHASGIQCLIDEFNYHPVFKRWSDGFSAVPFKPK